MSAPDPTTTQEWMRRVERRIRQLEIGGPTVEVIDFPFASGWGNYDITFHPCVVRKSMGEVRIFGLMGRPGSSFGATTTPQTIGVLPVGFRPVHTVLNYSYANDVGVVRIDITPDGTVTIRWLVATAYTQNGYFLDLTPITFPAGG